MSIENLKTYGESLLLLVSILIVIANSCDCIADPFAEADEDTGQSKQAQNYIHIRIQRMLIASLPLLLLSMHSLCPHSALPLLRADPNPIIVIVIVNSHVTHDYLFLKAQQLPPPAPPYPQQHPHMRHSNIHECANPTN